MTIFSAATSVTQATIVNPPPYVVDGDQNVELQCTVTLSSTIGPDYSALSIDWRDSSIEAVQRSHGSLLEASLLVISVATILTHSVKGC